MQVVISGGVVAPHFNPMIARTLVLAGFLVAVALVRLPAATEQLSVDDIKPGMVGIGRTVFEGARLDEFKAHILGVLRNSTGPRRNLILARLEGGPLAETGVIAGMSGSPIYVDGKLIGAVSYSLGAFSKSPIAGITPIAEMIEAASFDTPRANARLNARLEMPLTAESAARAMRQAFTWTRPFADRPADVQAMLGASPGERIDPHIGTLLRPVATPLVMGGFTPETAELLSIAFRDSGFVPVVGGASGVSETSAPAGPLQPGDALGISLISGDLALGATGTVTHVDGDKVYAFGHPFYNLGPTEFPMTRAYVHTLLPSLFTSMKIATTGEVIGTLKQDRATTVAGTLGSGPALIPIRVELDSERGLKKSFTFKVVNDQLFTPLLAYVSILNTLGQYEREFGAATFSVKGKAVVKGHETLGFENIFSGEAPSIGTAAYVAAPITFLLSNDYEPVQIEALELTITSTEQPRTAALERVWVDAARPRAGRTVSLKILMRTYRGEEVTRTVPVEIPSHVTGTLSILVSDGSRLSQWEQRELRQPLQPRGVPQMIRALNNAKKNNRLYVRLISSDPGAVVNGEYLSALPPSVLDVLEADRHSGSFAPLRSAVVGEWELATEHAVTGSRLLTINVDQN